VAKFKHNQTGAAKIKIYGKFLTGNTLERQRISRLRKRISFLKHSQRDRFLNKRAAIHKKRSELLNRFRINYLPLCMDEDLERYAKYFAKEEKKEKNT
jgi:hypothetical protein